MNKYKMYEFKFMRFFLVKIDIAKYFLYNNLTGDKNAKKYKQSIKR